MNWYFIFKCVVSGLIVGLVSEISRRSTLVGAITASLPLTSILAIIWLYRDTGDIQGVISLSNNIALIVLPSLVFFIGLSLLLKQNFSFYPSLIASCALMAIVYVGYVAFLKKVGIQV